MADPRRRTVAQGYDELGRRYGDWAHGAADDARRQMLDRFAAMLPAGARVLDIGCGPGVPSTAWLAERFEVTGVDVSPVQLELARSAVPGARYICADILDLDFPAASFDGAVALYSVSHVPRSQHGRLFQRVHDWLAPGGVLLAVLGARDAPDWTGEWLGVPMFFSAHDAATNRRLMVAAGFELVIAEVRDVSEPEGPVSFLWVLARRPGDVSSV